MSGEADGSRRNWRHREKRISTRILAKRVSAEDHEVVVAYAKTLHVTVADLLGPAVEELIGRARAFMVMTTEDVSDHDGHEAAGG